MKNAKNPQESDNTEATNPQDIAPEGIDEIVESLSNEQGSDNSSTEVQNLETKVAELTNDLQRTRADFENYRKQVEVQKSQSLASGKYATIEKILPLIDDFSRALSAYPEQLEPLKKGFEKTLSSINLSQIDSNPDTEFNPDFHDAISVEDEGGEREVVAETLRPGYLYEGAVIRPAMVKVKRI